MGNHYKGKGEYYPQPKSGSPFAGKHLKRWEKNRLAYREAIRNAYEHPFGTLKVTGLKIAYVVFPSGDKLYLKKDVIRPPVVWILLSALFFETVAVGVAVYVAKNRKTENTGLLWLNIASVVLVTVIVFFAERFRMTAYPAAIPIAAAGLLYLIAEKGDVRRKITSVAVFLLIQIAAATYILIFRPNVIERTLFFLGRIT
jgi:hypothetical protein